MKSIYCLVFFFFIYSFISAQDSKPIVKQNPVIKQPIKNSNSTLKIITVENADQFVDAIGPNRTIQIKGGPIYLANITQRKSGKYYKLNEGDDGFELEIINVDNLRIVGVGNKPVGIITKPSYGNVIIFDNCNDIIIENINAGHGPEKGHCEGGVFLIRNSNNFTINKSIMYGSGAEGITAYQVTGLKCNNSIIKECTRSIMSFDFCNEIEFNNCKFIDNENNNLILLTECMNIQYNTCSFSNNLSTWGDYFFYTSKSLSIVLKDCLLNNNTATYFCNTEKSLELINTKFENNSFKKGLYKE